MSHSSDLSKLLSQAAATGTLSQATVAAQASVLGGDLGQIVIAGAAGVDAEDLVASDVTLVTVLVDASTSIHTRGLEDAVIRGYGELVDAFDDARERDSVLLALWTFNDEARVVHAYVPVGDATRLDPSNYRGLGGTKLYDTFCDGVLANVAYAERLRAAGTPTRSIVVVLTDGEDCGSRRRASHCQALARDVLASETFQLAFVGVGTDVDFHDVAKKMGFPRGSVAVSAQATASSIRALFRMVSQSTLRMSRARAGVPTGGFFAP